MHKQDDTVQMNVMVTGYQWGLNLTQQSNNRHPEHENRHSGSVKGEGFLDHSVRVCTLMYN